MLLQAQCPFHDGDRTIVLLRWVVTGPFTSLLPALDAELEPAAAEAGAVRLTLHGFYHPPLGEAGVAVDRLPLHRLAWVVARNF